MRHRFTTLNFALFVDGNTGLLSENLGRYWNPGDSLHLGSKGVRMFAQLIREHVHSSKITSGKRYSDVLRGTDVAVVGRDHGTTSPGLSSPDVP